MTEDLVSRIKALEDQLNPPLDKMSTMKATNRLKRELDALKVGSQEDAVWWLFARIEALEKENEKLKEIEHEHKGIIVKTYCPNCRYDLEYSVSHIGVYEKECPHCEKDFTLVVSSEAIDFSKPLKKNGG